VSRPDVKVVERETAERKPPASIPAPKVVISGKLRDQNRCTFQGWGQIPALEVEAVGEGDADDAERPVLARCHLVEEQHHIPILVYGSRVDP